ncbi:MAG: hypothetical protein WCJ64_07635 [Rhodospirillaceae bacterium]
MDTLSMPGAQAGSPLTVPRSQRRHNEAELKKRAENVRRRIGHAPPAGALKRLAAGFRQHGLADAGRLDQIEQGGFLDGDDDHRLAAYAALIKAAAPTMADKMLDEAARLHGADRFEIAALSPVGTGRASFSGRLPEDRNRLRNRIIPLIGWENTYLGAQKRSDSWSGTTAANADEIADYLHLVLDFDRPAGVSAEAWAPVRDELVSLLVPLAPKLIDNSGNGVQAWFGLVPNSDRAEIERRPRLFSSAMAALGVALADKAKVDDVSDAARIMRAPWSVNVLNKAKRDKGCEIALAYPRHQGDGKVWNPDELDAAIRTVFGAPAAATISSTPTTNTSTAAADRAPSMEALRQVVGLIPNAGDFDSRDAWVAFAHAVWGAAGGDPEGREIFCAWSAQWPGGGDPEAAGVLFDGIRESRVGWGHLLGLARKYAPGAAAALTFADSPVDPADLERTAADLEGADKPGRKSAKEKALDALAAAGAEFWHTSDGRAFMSLDGRSYDLGMGGDQGAVRGWLAGRGVSLSKNARADLFDHIGGLCLAGAEHEASVRIALRDTPFGPWAYLDLGTPSGEMVQITGSGWSVIPGAGAPVWFWRPTGAKALPSPAQDDKPDGFLARLVQHLNLPAIQDANDPTDAGVMARARLLLLLGGWSVPLGAVPHGLMSGPQGSAKSTAARRLKALLDPSAGSASIGNADPRELFSVARAGLVLVLDNLSEITDAMSDTLCALATGAAHSKRRLYSDGDVSILQAKRGVIFTTIAPDLLRRGDLVDRTVALNLDAIKARRTEAELDAAWDADHPALLALWLDALAGALDRLPDIQKAMPAAKLPRLADAALVAEAVAQAMGWSAGLLLDAIGADRKQAAIDLANNDPLVVRLIGVMRSVNGGTWTGTPADLNAKVQAQSGPPWGRRGGPQSARGMTSALARAAGPLREAFGWETRLGERAKDASRRRLIHIDTHGNLPDATDIDPQPF